MKDCETCGNEIPDSEFQCRFCGSHQRLTRTQARSANNVRTVNIEANRPSVDEALERLESELARARQSSVRIIRLIHGWGSSGTGGKLREACRTYLQSKLGARQIKGVVPGDDYSRATVGGRRLMEKCPSLRASERSDAQNPGITFIEL